MVRFTNVPAMFVLVKVLNRIRHRTNTTQQRVVCYKISTKIEHHSRERIPPPTAKQPHKHTDSVIRVKILIRGRNDADQSEEIVDSQSIKLSTRKL